MEISKQNAAAEISKMSRTQPVHTRVGGTVKFSVKCRLPLRMKC